MKLIIDKGNTRCKWQIKKFNEVVDNGVIDTKTGDDKISIVTTALNNIINQYGIKDAVMGCVGDGALEIMQLLNAKCEKTLFVKGDTPSPLKSNYPTLGADRLGAIVGAWNLFPKQNILAIDAGSCITYDVVLKNSNYIGGNISAGLPLRALAMSEHTNALPLINYLGTNLNEIPLIGYNLNTAMQAGLIHGFCFEIEGFVKHLETILENLQVVITGGDAHFFEEYIKLKAARNIHFVNDLVLRGYDDLFTYNNQQR